ncbi:hypothetical protein JD844_022467 [Phrynosoma platyrhinos]|uniref:Uncharacterized protein n=1 Tax=Phrynosoma platyrhinos TaxID=52577 RepID=A0ABQ7SVE0_PHRPL|nr:hypothetical protein JD844_022467 [Phrynosoma platyrhinos]
MPSESRGEPRKVHLINLTQFVKRINDVMENATVGNASATVVMSGTTAIAQQRQTDVFPMMARCAVAEATASVGNVSAQNLVPLGRLVRNVPPAPASAVQKGIALSVCCLTQEDWLTTKPVKNTAEMRSLHEWMFSAHIQQLLNCVETDDPHSVLCAYPVKDCVMKFTYSELTSGKTNITVLKEPGDCCFVVVASNPLYRKPISTHSLDFTFNKLNRTYNGTVD